MGILKRIRHLSLKSFPAYWEAHAILVRNASDLVGDAGGVLDLLLADPMQRLQVLLRQRFDRDRVQAGPMGGLADGQRIARVALAATHKRLDVLGRDQNHVMAKLLECPAPVVGAGASCATVSVSAARLTGRLDTIYPARLRAQTWNTFFARSIPTVVVFICGRLLRE